MDLIVRLMVSGARKLMFYNLVGAVLAGILVHQSHNAYVLWTAIFVTLAVITLALGWLGWALNGPRGIGVYQGVRDATMLTWISFGIVECLNIVFPEWGW